MTATATVEVAVATTAVSHVFAGQLAKALDLAVPASGASAVLDWTGRVRIESKPGRIDVACTDLIWQVQTHAKTIGTAGEWAALVDARKLHSLVRTFPAEAQVKLALRDNRLVVECQRSNSKLPTGDPEVFPLLSEKRDKGILVGADRWVRAIQATTWAAAGPNTPQPPLTAVQFEAYHDPNGDDFVVASATDGNAASVWRGMGRTGNGVTVNLPIGTTSSTFRLPASTLDKIAPLLKKYGDAETWAYLAGSNPENPGMVIWACREPEDDPAAEPRTLIALRCQEGPFPALPMLLEKIEATEMQHDGAVFSVEPESLLSTLRRALITSDSNSKGYTPVDMRLADDSTLMVNTSGKQSGEGKDEVDIIATSGAGNEFRLAATYLSGALDACRAFGGEATVRFTSRVSPTVFTPDADDSLAIMAMAMSPDGGEE